MRNKREYFPKEIKEKVFEAKHVEVSLQECGGDFNKMLKKFTRKVRKEEVLSPFYDRLAFHTTKSQRRRLEKFKGIYETKKREMKKISEEE